MDSYGLPQGADSQSSQKYSLDFGTWAAEVSPALRDDLLAAIACGIQRSFEINHATVRVSAPQPCSEAAQTSLKTATSSARQAPPAER